jgi:DNA-directed RNA polymerase specialized sigma24 family protein
MHLRLVTELLLGGLMLYLWIRQRRELKRHIIHVSNRLNHLESAFSGFITECEKTLSEFSLRITDINRPRPLSLTKTQSPEAPSEMKSLLFQEETIANRRSSETTPKDEPTSFRTASRDTREFILRMARDGATSREIAVRLGIPQGEVELVLNLCSAATHSKKAHAVTFAS